MAPQSAAFKVSLVYALLSLHLAVIITASIETGSAVTTLHPTKEHLYEVPKYSLNNGSSSTTVSNVTAGFLTTGSSTTIDESNSSTADESSTSTTDESSTSTTDESSTSTNDESSTSTTEQSSTSTTEQSSTSTTEQSSTSITDESNTSTTNESSSSTTEDTTHSISSTETSSNTESTSISSTITISSITTEGTNFSAIIVHESTSVSSKSNFIDSTETLSTLGNVEQKIEVSTSLPNFNSSDTLNALELNHTATLPSIKKEKKIPAHESSTSTVSHIAHSNAPIDKVTKKQRKPKSLNLPDSNNTSTRPVNKQKSFPSTDQMHAINESRKPTVPTINHNSTPLTSSVPTHSSKQSKPSTESNETSVLQTNSADILIRNSTDNSVASSVSDSVTNYTTHNSSKTTVPEHSTTEENQNLTNLFRPSTSSYDSKEFQATMYYSNNNTNGNYKPPMNFTTIPSGTTSQTLITSTTRSSAKTISTNQGEEMSIGSMALIITLGLVVLVTFSMTIAFAIYRARSGRLFDDSISLMTNRHGQRRTFYYDTTI